MKILDVKVDDIALNDVLVNISRWIKEPKSKLHYIVTVNPEMILAAQNNPDHKTSLNNADLAIADGFGILLAAKLLRKKIHQRITGVDLVEHLARLSPQKNWRWFLLGANPGVAKRAANKLIQKYPGINIVKAEDGGMISLDNLHQQQKLIERINLAKPDILLVAFGVPKQELFMNYYCNSLDVKVAIGVGGTLDFISGKSKRAPKILRKLGLEWLWRLIMQPSRIKRIYNATIKFTLLILRSHRE